MRLPALATVNSLKQFSGEEKSGTLTFFHRNRLSGAKAQNLSSKTGHHR
jgi:hypothetical protein